MLIFKQLIIGCNFSFQTFLLTRNCFCVLLKLFIFFPQATYHHPSTPMSNGDTFAPLNEHFEPMSRASISGLLPNLYAPMSLYGQHPELLYQSNPYQTKSNISTLPSPPPSSTNDLHNYKTGISTHVWFVGVYCANTLTNNSFLYINIYNFFDFLYIYLNTILLLIKKTVN